MKHGELGLRVVLAIGLIALLSGCSVDSQRIEWANDVCESNGGVAEIWRSGYFFTVTTCENGASFDGHDFE